MEKTISNDKSTENELLILSNRKSLRLEGIVEIISTSDTALTLKLKDTTLCILGENINITKLDITTGILEANGKFVSIKYGVKSGNIFKRLFK